MKRWCSIGVAVGMVLFASGPLSAEDGAGTYAIVASSFLGGRGFDDAVVGARIQSDGTIVLAANLAPDIARHIQGAGKGGGTVIRLSADGTKVLSVKTVASEVKDMAVDAKDSIVLAAGDDGVIKLNADGARQVWTARMRGCVRVDAAADGHVAAIADGRIHVLDPAGKVIGRADGSHYTCDVCIDGASKTVVFTGFRNARAFDGKRTYPVQICYVHGLDYKGKRKWTNYNWSTDRTSDRFLNKPTNNMADSRGDRCTIGRDGKLYVTFQVAGGNHLFRYSPRNIMTKSPIVGGDNYHKFHNSRAEHKCFFARFSAATGDYLAGQQFCGRLSSGRANAVVTKEGEITADEAGRVYVVGRAASGLPLTMNPGGEDYTGGGFILVMSPDLKTRLLVTRTAAGKGSPRALDVRTTKGKTRAVWGGSGVVEGMFVTNAVQERAVDVAAGKKDPKDAFFAVIEKK